MTEFKKYKLGDICDLNKNSLKVSDTFDTIEYLDTSSITENTIDSFQNFSREDAPSRAQRKVQNETIIFSTVRPNQNHFGLIQNPKTNLIVSSGFTTLDVKDKIEFDAKYLYYNLTQPSIVNFLQTLAQNSVSAYPSINPDDIGNLYLRFPEVSTQKKIASVLSNIDRKISVNREINRNLEELAKQIYDYWFVQFDFPNEEGKPYKSSGGKMVWNETLKREIPADWEVKKLNACLKHINTGLNPRDNFVLGNGSIKYITVKNLTTDGTIDFSGCDLIDENARTIVHERSKISKGDILFASISPLGRCYIIQEQPEKWDINESVFSIRPNQKIITPEYLYCYLTSEWFMKKAEKEATGSIFAGIRMAALNAMTIIVPDEKVLKRFSSLIKPIFEQKDKLFNEIQHLTKLRDKLLPLLMNGQVTLNSYLSDD